MKSIKKVLSTLILLMAALVGFSALIVHAGSSLAFISSGSKDISVKILDNGVSPNPPVVGQPFTVKISVTPATEFVKLQGDFEICDADGSNCGTAGTISGKNGGEFEMTLTLEDTSDLNVDGGKMVIDFNGSDDNIGSFDVISNAFDYPKLKDPVAAGGGTPSTSNGGGTPSTSNGGGTPANVSSNGSSQPLLPQGGFLAQDNLKTPPGGLAVCDVKLQPGTSESTAAVTNDSCQLQDLFKLIARVTNFLIGLAALYAVTRIVIAGGRMVLSAGNTQTIESGKKGLNNAIVGFVLVMIAFLLINTLFIVIDLSAGLPFSFANPVSLLK